MAGAACMFAAQYLSGPSGAGTDGGAPEGASSSNHFATPRGMVSAKSAAVIKATLGPVVENLDTIVGTFYDTMFEANPEVLAFFNMTNQRNGNQRKSLAASLLAAVPCTLEPGKLEALASHLDVVFHKHVALGVLPEHYGIVHDNFMCAVGKVLGDAVTQEVADAWSEAVMVVADVFIRYEVALAASVEAATNGWKNPEPMKVVSVEDAAGDGSSKTVTLEMVAPGISTVWLPGQYLTLLGPEEWGLTAPRHYTIVDGDLTKLSITVKKLTGENGASDGLLSSYVHSLQVGDTVRARPPMGVFVSTPRPEIEVFIGGGVGVTPILPLARKSLDDGAQVALFTSHSTRESGVLLDEMDALTSHKGVVHAHQAFTRQGDARLSGPAIASALQSLDIDPTHRSVVYHICAPRAMIADVVDGLHGCGVVADNIKFESFGPTGDLHA